MARFARKQMADLRAMEEQAERENIIDPREVTTEELLSGSGKHKHTLQDHMRHPFKGFGSADEARAAGRQLGHYLGKNHGYRYAKEFAGGCGEWVGGALGDDEESGNVTQSGTYRGLGATPSMGLSEVRGGGGIVGGKKACGGRKARLAYEPVASQLKEVTIGSGRRRGGLTPNEISEIQETDALEEDLKRRKMTPAERRAYDEKKRRDDEYARNLDDEMEANYDPVRDRLTPAQKKVYDAEKAQAKASGSGKPKRTNARAAVVKKVMASKGLSMIEASKYVKQHKLY